MKILWWDISLISTINKERDLIRQLVLNKDPEASLLMRRATPKYLTEYLKDVFPHTKVVHGKQGQGDIVVINMEPNECLTLEEYLKPILPVRKIETVGIYTNVYFDKRFFQKVLGKILKSK